MHTSLNREHSATLKPAWSRRPAPRQQHKRLLTIPTFQGTYYVPCRLEYVQELIRSEHIRATCLNRGHRHFHQFLRGLFVLATEEAIIECDESSVRDLIADLRDTDERR